MCLKIYEIDMRRIYNIILISVILFAFCMSSMAQGNNNNTFYDDGFTVTDNTFNPNRALEGSAKGYAPMDY